MKNMFRKTTKNILVRESSARTLSCGVTDGDALQQKKATHYAFPLLRLHAEGVHIGPPGPRVDSAKHCQLPQNGNIHKDIGYRMAIWRSNIISQVQPKFLLNKGPEFTGNIPSFLLNEMWAHVGRLDTIFKLIPTHTHTHKKKHILLRGDGNNQKSHASKFPNQPLSWLFDIKPSNIWNN